MATAENYGPDGNGTHTIQPVACHFTDRVTLSCPMRNGNCFPMGKVAWAWNWLLVSI